MAQPDQDYDDDVVPDEEPPQEIFPFKMGFGQIYTQDFDYRSPLNDDSIVHGEADLDPKDVSADAELALLSRDEVIAIGSHPSGSAPVIETAPADLKTPATVETPAVPSTVPTRLLPPTDLPRLPSSKKA